MYVSTLTGPKCKSLKGYVGPKLIARRLLVVASRVDTCISQIFAVKATFTIFLHSNLTTISVIDWWCFNQILFVEVHLNIIICTYLCIVPDIPASMFLKSDI